MSARDPTPSGRPPPSPVEPAVGGGGPTPPPPRRRSLLARLLAWGFLFLALVAAGAGVAAFLAYRHFARGLPDIPTLTEYRPPVVTELVSSDGQVAGEL
ncbi:MAG: hypothetical protein ACJ79L_12555, partial [Anaeromyxobacteraceae bacterium]